MCKVEEKCTHASLQNVKAVSMSARQSHGKFSRTGPLSCLSDRFKPPSLFLFFLFCKKRQFCKCGHDEEALSELRSAGPSQDPFCREPVNVADASESTNVVTHQNVRILCVRELSRGFSAHEPGGPLHFTMKA